MFHYLYSQNLASDENVGNLTMDLFGAAKFYFFKVIPSLPFLLMLVPLNKKCPLLCHYIDFFHTKEKRRI